MEFMVLRSPWSSTTTPINSLEKMLRLALTHSSYTQLVLVWEALAQSKSGNIPALLPSSPAQALAPVLCSHLFLTNL